MQSNRDHFRWGAFGVRLACVASLAACFDYTAAPLGPDMATGSNQPGSGGSNSPDDGMAGSGGSTGDGGGSAGTNAMGTGEAAGQGIGLDNGTAGSSGGSTAVGLECSSDSDSDGVNDCDEGCPQDAFKAQPGVCGCGVPDTDLDADGMLDCQEACPNDPVKLVPGVCGCGRADVDTDLDGALDCNDGCLYDPALQAAGPCGCGAPANLPLCLRHRYSFNGTGDVATDSAGTADADIVNATLAGNGTLVLAGGVSDQYVNLPPNIISRVGVSATIETWVTWTGAGAPWQRIFDFGSSNLAPGQQGDGATYLFVTPSNTINAHVRAAFTTAGPAAERTVNGPTALPFGVRTHIAVVIDGVAQTLTLYQDGVLLDVPAPTVDTTLAQLNDVNNWIGRSQFMPDEEFQGVIDEVRIYGVARSAAQIAAEATAGPNTLPAQ